jgi:precorrin-2/cobalt-factor-2 C20-methyltransferase
MKLKLYGIGVGPGDPELLTLKACRILKEVELIVAPRSRREKESLAWSVVKGIIEERKVKPIVIQPIFPMIKDRKKLEIHWRETAARVLERSEKCKTKKIAFITLGDPSLYSTFYRFLSAIQSLSKQIEIEIIPGVTSFSACSALARVPIAEGEKTAAIIPSPRAISAARNFDTIIYMKPLSIQSIKNQLNDKCKAILGTRIGMQGQAIIYKDLNEVPEPKDYLSILIIRRG